MDLWDALDLNKRCVLACTGAGGKTSAIMTLTRCARNRGLPVLVTATTKMYCSQVESLDPVFTADFDSGLDQVVLRLKERGAAAWFARAEGEKVVGLSPELIDRLAASLPFVSFFIEADGAKGRWLKAPADHEPVVPSCVTDTVGILNLAAVGKPLSDKIVHRLPLVAQLLQKAEGEIVEEHDVAVLAMHERGIFKSSRGRKTLVLAGADAAPPGIGQSVARRLALTRSGIRRCIEVQGFGEAVAVVEVYDL